MSERMQAIRRRSSQGQKWGNDKYAPAIDEVTGFKVKHKKLTEDYDGVMTTKDNIDGRHPALDPPPVFETRPIKDARPDTHRNTWQIHVRANLGVGIHIVNVPTLTYRRAVSTDTYYFWTQDQDMDDPVTDSSNINEGNERHADEHTRTLDWDIPSWDMNDRRRLFVAHHADGSAYNNVLVADNPYNQIQGFTQVPGTATINNHDFVISRSNQVLKPEGIAGERFRISIGG